MKHYIYLALSLFFSNFANSQCPSGSVSISNQAQLTAFLNQYPTCTQINGNINVNWSSDIIDLSELGNIEHVTGQVYIRGNSALNSTLGLHNIEVAGSVFFRDNNALESFNMTSLDSISGFFYARENYITALSGLSSLRVVGTYLELSDLDLTDLDGLQNLISIGTNLVLDDLQDINDISQLNNQLVVGGNLSIKYNSQLAICSVEAVCSHLSIGGQSEFYLNKQGCKTIEEVIDNCPTPPGCGEMTLPSDGSTSIDIGTNIGWGPVSGVDGYILDVGTSPLGTGIVDSLNTGNVTVYNLPSDLPYNTTIYVMVRTHTGGVISTGCFESSFSTEINPAYNTAFVNNNSSITTQSENSTSSDWYDINGDGRLDVIIGNSYGDAQNDVFLNLGNMTFLEQEFGDLTTDAKRSEDVKWIHLNDDDFVDVYVANNGGGQTNDMYINTGNNSFIKVDTGYIATDAFRSEAIAYGDIDGDGDIDVFVANASNQANNLYINNGNTTFTKRTSGHIVTATKSSYSAHMCDIDGDNDLDLFVGNSGQNFLYKNDGTGVFTQMLAGDLATLSTSSRSIDFIDFDLDGDLDALEGTSNTTEGAAIYENDGTGIFTKVPSGTLSTSSEAAVWSLLNDDIYPDVYMGSFNGQGKVLINKGDGTFEQTTGEFIHNYPVGYLYGIHSADYDNDGDYDIFLAKGGGYSAQTNVMLENKIAEPGPPCPDLFIEKIDLSSAAYPALDYTIKIRNVGATSTDIANVALRIVKSENIAYEDADDVEVELTTLTSTSYVLQPGDYYTYSMSTTIDTSVHPYIIGNIDENDIVIECLETNAKSRPVIYGCIEIDAHNYNAGATVSAGCLNCSDGIQNGDETGIDCGGEICLSCLPECTTLSSPVDGSVFINVNTDLEWTASSANTLGYSLSVGSCAGCTNILDSIDVGNTLVYASASPFQYDSIYVRVYPYSIYGSSTGCEESFFTTYDPTTCSKIKVRDTIAENYFSEDMIPVDVDGDNDIDIVGGLGVQNQVLYLTYYQNDGAGNLTELPLNGLDFKPNEIVFDDIDADSNLDIIEHDGTRLRWWANDGNQNYTVSVIDAALDFAGEIITGDYDNDGDVDILCSTDDNSFRVMYLYTNNGSASFTKNYIYYDSYLRSYKFADLDGDNDLDIIAYDLTEDSLILLVNNGSSFSYQSIDASPNAYVYIDDHDDDGDPDIYLMANELYLYTNEGGLTFSKQLLAAGLEPALRHLSFGDFDGDFDTDIGMVSVSSGYIYMLNRTLDEYCVSILDTLPQYNISQTGMADIDQDGQVDLMVANTNVSSYLYKYNDATAYDQCLDIHDGDLSLYGCDGLMINIEEGKSLILDDGTHYEDYFINGGPYHKLSVEYTIGGQTHIKNQVSSAGKDLAFISSAKPASNQMIWNGAVDNGITISREYTLDNGAVDIQTQICNTGSQTIDDIYVSDIVDIDNIDGCGTFKLYSDVQPTKLVYESSCDDVYDVEVTASGADIVLSNAWSYGSPSYNYQNPYDAEGALIDGCINVTYYIDELLPGACVVLQSAQQTATDIGCELMVSSVNYTGAGSLASAMACASAGDTITFAPSLNGQSILIPDDIVVGQNLILIGNSPTSFVHLVMAGNSPQLSVPNNTSLHLENLMITTSRPGIGDIIKNDGQITLKNMVIKMNDGSLYNLNNQASGQLTIMEGVMIEKE